MDDRIEWVLEQAQGPTVIDLGAVQHDADAAGNEDWLHGHLADEFETVIGIDRLEEAVSRLRSQGFDVRAADATALDLDVTADSVVAGELLEHVGNPLGVLTSAREHLHEDGRLLITTPNPWALVHFQRALRGEVQVNDEHTAWFGPETLAELCRRAGFEIETLRTTRRPHRGLQRLAQWLGSDRFGGTTWLCRAEVAA